MPRRNSNPRRGKNVEYATKPLLEETMERFSDFLDPEPSPLREGGVLLRNTGGAQPSILPEFVYMSTREDQFLQLNRIDDLTVRRSHKPYIQFSDTRSHAVRHGFIGNEIYEWPSKDLDAGSTSPFNQPVIVVPVYENYNYASNQGVGAVSYAYLLGSLLETSHWYYAASRSQALGGLRCVYADSPVGIPQVIGIQHVTNPWQAGPTILRTNLQLHVPVVVRRHETQHISPNAIGTATSGTMSVTQNFPVPVSSSWIMLFIIAQIKVGITYQNYALSTETFGLKFFVRSAASGSDTGYATQVATYTHSGKPFTSYAYQGDVGSNECSDLNWFGPAEHLYNYGIRWERVGSTRDSSDNPVNLSQIRIVVGPSVYFVCGGALKQVMLSPPDYVPGT
jgi:hypothetical protein